jgi:hypothetical protein
LHHPRVASAEPDPCNPIVTRTDKEWRTRAMTSFPELREEVQDEDEMPSVYSLFSELEFMVRGAHREGNEDRLRRIYGYASWARVQGDDDIQNAAGVSFYEHFFDEPWMRPLVIPWINSSVVSEYMGLWEFRLSEPDLEEVQQLLYRARLMHLTGHKRKRRR